MTENKNVYDLFSNPMVDSAKKAMSQEQLEEYKRMGQYMYSQDAYKIVEQGANIKKENDEDTLKYAVESLKSGLHPRELSIKEIELLAKKYGNAWYKTFDYTEQDIPQFPFITQTKLSRQERRLRERIARKKISKRKN